MAHCPVTDIPVQNLDRTSGSRDDWDWDQNNRFEVVGAHGAKERRGLGNWLYIVSGGTAAIGRRSNTYQESVSVHQHMVCVDP